MTTVTAQESRKNQLKDFVHIAGPLHVSHFLILTATEQAAYLRLAKVPRVSTHCKWLPSQMFVEELSARRHRCMQRLSHKQHASHL